MNVIDAGVHLAEVYARALFELARPLLLLRKELQGCGGPADSSKMISAVKDDLDVVMNVRAREKDFGALMVSPYFSPDYKQQMVQKIFSEKLNDLTVDFLKVVIQHNRMVFLPQIVNRFNELVEAHHGFQIVQVTVSEPLAGDQAEKLSADVAAAIGHKVKLQVDVNPAIMGGIVIRFGDRVIDNSIRSRLRRAIGAIMSRPKRQEKADEI